MNLTCEQLRADLRLRRVTLTLDGSELVVRGPASKDDITMLKSRKPELIAYLAGSGSQHRRGRLDEYYRLDLDDFGLTPPARELPSLRHRYFSWPYQKRALFNSRVDDRALLYGRVEAEFLVAEDMEDTNEER